jgi:peroxiredoxin
MADDEVGRGAPAAGTVVPDFTLPDQHGNSVRLYDRLEAGPVVLSFYRGMWCPFCNFELRALQSALPEFERLGASLIAISPQKPDFTVSTADLNALTFAVLSDSGNVAAEAYGLVMDIPQAIVEHQRDDLGFDVADYNGSADRKVPVPATLLIGRDKKVVFRFVNPDYRYRVEPADILAALRDSAASVSAHGS